MSQGLKSVQPVASILPLAERSTWVDVAKALCIILVVMMHSTLGLQNAVEAKGFLDPVVAYFAPFRIPTFFVLSGLFMERALKRGFGEYLRTRVLHFGYFYLLWLAIHIAVRSGSQLLAEPDDAAAEFLFALVEPYAALWFLHLLVALSLAAFALRRVNPMITLAAAATLHLFQLKTGSSLIDEFAGRAVFFAAGWLMAPFFFALARSAQQRPGQSAAAIAGFAAINAAIVFRWEAEHLPFVSLALSIAGAGAMVLLAVHLAALPRLSSILAALGRRTLEIYVAFTLPMAAVRLLLLGVGFERAGWIEVGFASLGITIIAIIAPLLLARAVRGTLLRFLFVRPEGQAFAGGASPDPEPLSVAQRARIYRLSPPVVGMRRSAPAGDAA